MCTRGCRPSTRRNCSRRRACQASAASASLATGASRCSSTTALCSRCARPTSSAARTMAAPRRRPRRRSCRPRRPGCFATCCFPTVRARPRSAGRDPPRPRAPRGWERALLGSSRPRLSRAVVVCRCGRADDDSALDVPRRRRGLCARGGAVSWLGSEAVPCARARERALHSGAGAGGRRASSTASPSPGAERRVSRLCAVLPLRSRPPLRDARLSLAGEDPCRDAPH